MSSVDIAEVSPEQADDFRHFCQLEEQTAYTRPDLGITADLFSREIFDLPEAVATYAGYTAVTENTRAWMALDAGGEIVGTVGAKRQKDYCEQNSLYVAPELKGHGIGRALFNHVLEFAGLLPIRVDLVDYMEETRAIYEHWGFVADPSAGKPGCIWWKYWPEEAQKNFQMTYMFRPGADA